MVSYNNNNLDEGMLDDSDDELYISMDAGSAWRTANRDRYQRHYYNLQLLEVLDNIDEARNQRNSVSQDMQHSNNRNRGDGNASVPAILPISTAQGRGRHPIEEQNNGSVSIEQQNDESPLVHNKESPYPHLSIEENDESASDGKMKDSANIKRRSPTPSVPIDQKENSADMAGIMEESPQFPPLERLIPHRLKDKVIPPKPKEHVPKTPDEKVRIMRDVLYKDIPSDSDNTVTSRDSMGETWSGMKKRPTNPEELDKQDRELWKQEKRASRKKGSRDRQNLILAHEPNNDAPNSGDEGDDELTVTLNSRHQLKRKRSASGVGEKDEPIIVDSPDGGLDGATLNNPLLLRRL